MRRLNLPQHIARLSLLLSALFAFSLLMTSASTLAACGPSLSGKKVDWPSYVPCVEGAVSDAVSSVSAVLLGDGTDSSIGQRGKQELNDLAIKHGADTIACLVQRLVSDWSSPGAAQDPGVIAAAQRGRAFLSEVGTTVRFEDDGGSGGS